MFESKKFQKYFEWSSLALLGGDPVGCDKFLNENFFDIKEVAQYFLKDYTPSLLYRGVILTEKVDTLKPHPNFTALSFSEDKKIAESFADSSANGFGTVFYLGDKGYVVEYTPKKEEVLFHYKMFEFFPYKERFESWDISGFDDLVAQREVIIIQPKEDFKNIKEFIPS
jgi:hypothetical protein